MANFTPPIFRTGMCHSVGIWMSWLSGPPATPYINPCVQHTYLTGIPLFVAVSLLPWFVYTVRSSRNSALKLQPLLAVKFVIIVLAMLAEIVNLVLTLLFRSDGLYASPTWVIAPLVTLVLLTILTVEQLVCIRQGVISCGSIHLPIIVMMLATVPQMHFVLTQNTESTYRTYTGFKQLFSVILTIIYCFADVTEGASENTSPVSTASFASRQTISWISSLVWLGFRRPITKDDIFALDDEDNSENVYKKFKKYSMIEKEKVTKSVGYKVQPTSKTDVEIHFANVGKSGKSETFSDPKPSSDVLVEMQKTNSSLVMTVLRMDKSTWIAATVGRLVESCIQISFPIVLRNLIRHVASESSEPWEGYAYAILLFGLHTTLTLTIHPRVLMLERTKLRAMSATTTAVFEKTLRLSHQARSEKNVGEICNLWAMDVQSLRGLTEVFVSSWSNVFQMSVVVYLIHQQLGPAVFIGFSSVIVVIMLISLSIPKVHRLQQENMKNKDNRLKLLNELLGGIKVIKMYAWEDAFEKMISKVRNDELQTMKKICIFIVGAVTTVVGFPSIISMGCFVSYMLLNGGKSLTAEQVFVSVALFNQTRFLLMALPQIGGAAVALFVSNRRLTAYLNAEELDENCIEPLSPEASTAVVIDHATFNFTAPAIQEDHKDDDVEDQDSSGSIEVVPIENKAILTDISITVASASLVAIVGRTGAGKSALLSALLGEMHVNDGGRVAVAGRVAYAAQQPWIQNMSLRDNIIFKTSSQEATSKHDEAQYDAVIDACALRPDLLVLPHGDATIIGEKGINLSGGQKQRVSLARAVFADADVYLLDDPMSAVDAHVGKHLFEKVIGPGGILKDKTRILITHHLTFLPKCDNVFVIDGGKIVERGTYDELMEQSGTFTELITQMKADDELEEDGESDDGIQFFNPPVYLVDEPDVPLVGHVHRRRLTTGDSHHSRHIENAKPSTEIEPEEEAVGRVKFAVYRQMISAMGYGFTILFLLLYVASVLSEFTSNAWLSEMTTHWMAVEGDGGPRGILPEWFLNRLEAPTVTMIIFCFFGIFNILFGASAVYVHLAISGIRCSRHYHDKLVNSLVRAPLRFFDVTPTGRMINRFGKDMSSIDQLFQPMVILWWFSAIGILGILTIATTVTPYFAVIIPPVVIVYFLITALYISSSRQLQRLTASTSSPVFSHIQETVQGAATIRAFGAQGAFVKEMQRRFDAKVACALPMAAVDGWMFIRIELIGGFIMFCTAAFAVFYAHNGTIPVAMLGLTLSYALNMPPALKEFVKHSVGIEKEVIATERIQEYIETESEAAWIIADSRPPSGWPVSGNVKMINYSTRYRDGLDLVLKKINIEFQAGHKIGIVGRTGAGKSSMTLALLRLIEPTNGRILIDDVDISTIGLHDLRSRITIIPQEALLFAGTLRVNVDPTMQHSDDAIWTALEKAHIKETVFGWGVGLDHEIAEGGNNVSAGQRQLVCLARALLRPTKILILDEATAAVDRQTDALIQATIREEFSSCTVVTIAHRIETIMDYDRIVVLADGRVVEFDTPKQLINTQHSLFRELVDEAGLL